MLDQSRQPSDNHFINNFNNYLQRRWTRWQAGYGKERESFEFELDDTIIEPYDSERLSHLKLRAKQQAKKI
jgi:hypothetical protein